MVPPEGLGELSRLAVAHAVCDLTHGHSAGAEEFESSPHSDRREVGTEARVPNLCEGSLQLASRRGDLGSDRVQVDLLGVVALDNRHGLPEQRLTALHCGISVTHHDL